MEPMREMSLMIKLKEVFGEQEAPFMLEWMRKDPKRFQEVMENLDKGRRPYVDFKTGETVYETIR